MDKKILNDKALEAVIGGLETVITPPGPGGLEDIGGIVGYNDKGLTPNPDGYDVSYGTGSNGWDVQPPTDAGKYKAKITITDEFNYGS